MKTKTNLKNRAHKNMRLKSFDNTKKVYSNLYDNFKDYEFFNLVCGNVFKNFLSVGYRSVEDIEILMKKYFGGFEYLILNILFKFESGQLTIKESQKYLDQNPFFKYLFYFVSILKNKPWEFFVEFSKKLKDSSCRLTLDTLRKLYSLKNLIKSLQSGFISEGHFKMAIKKYNINKNISLLNRDLNLLKNEFYDKFNFNIKEAFSGVSIGFYDAVIYKYCKYHLYTDASIIKKDLSFFLKRYKYDKLNKRKNSGKLSYIQNLALDYIGEKPEMPYARKPINLRYRAYRIFLYTFKFKPFQLWQRTRKSRNYKYGGLLVDHLSKYELIIKNILLMSNFCLNVTEVNKYLREGKICLNGKIILSPNYVVRPYDVIHFDEKNFRQERSRFLLNIASASYKNIFNKEFSQLFEYNFKTYSFIMLPNFFKYYKKSLAPYYTVYNSGRFKIERL